MDGSGGSWRAGHLLLYAGLWDFACTCTCITYVFLRDGLCDMYMMMGWSPGMYGLMYVCMHVCVSSVFPHYIIIIIVVQDYNFGAMTNHRL